MRAMGPARTLIENGRSTDAHRLFFEAAENGIDVEELKLTDKALKKSS